MNLEEACQSLQERTGRYDLNDPELIIRLNAGQRYLDNRIHNAGRSTAMTYRISEPGATGVTFSSTCRVIQAVYAEDQHCSSRLDKAPHAWIKEHFPRLPDQSNTGRPRYYYPCLMRKSPDMQTVGQMKAFFGYGDLTLGEDYGSNGIIFWPPGNGHYSICVVGQFYSPDLHKEFNPSSWWLTTHANLLLKASQRELEVEHRNTAGMKDFDASLEVEIQAITRDAIAQELADRRRSEGWSMGRY